MIKYKEYIPLVLFSLLVILSVLVIKPFILSIFVGALLAYILSPIFAWLQVRFKNKTIPALSICLVVLVILVVVGAFFVNTIIMESYVLFVLAKQKLATGIFTNCENLFCQSLEKFGQDPEISYHIQEGLKSVTNWVIQKGSNVLISLPRAFLSLFVVFFTMFYFLRDGDSLLSRLNLFLSMKQKKYTFIIKRLKEIVHGLVYGYFIVAFIQGALAALGFFIFGVSSPIFWGVVMGLLALIPLLGAGIIWVPASIILFLDGVFQDSTSLMIKGVALFFYCLLFVSSIDNILRPKLMGGKAKIHPAIIMLGIFGGIVAFGPLGVIVGPLLLSLTFIFIEIYITRKGEK